ncbi:hypothetical protein FHT82_006064 [Rhizobium sp. BK275]|uniref:hypothetical protein n=1 Tax=Rhizobium sp. BK275 TaxID=2587077 RepID=UPI001621BC1D|nr:hypothetical protein [Rhizobium sp. BK275]MBB3393270.1 hypothetical protein [Rhizobium sp. BK275]
MAVWGSQSVQFVWFLTSVENLRAEALYQALVGDEPDTSQRNKVPSPANPFLSTADGVIENRQFQLQVQPGRVDLIISAFQQELDQDITLLETVDEIQGVLEAIPKAAIEWPVAVRQSVVANLVAPVKNDAEAYSLFLETAEYALDLPDFSDPILQINRRKALKAGGFMNRLMRFGVAATQQFMFEINQFAGAGQAIPVSKQRFGCSLTLDINTVPDGRTIDSKHQITIFKELSQELIRLAELRSPKALAD